MDPIQLLIGTKMRNKEDIQIRDLRLEEMEENTQREFLRNDAKKNIENTIPRTEKTYNKKKIVQWKKKASVAIPKRAQFEWAKKTKVIGP
ncbi:hypothetical protein TNIN_297511 [Trichonephila inaurata madagascariensis]|uniref:Uncharacterized protein n=1 Tax=Trichonephila inaurata madagascariensis TaxID=2747483 RepID=A0A8X7C6Q9_9ARAC|nr:hypothetical protein TNIN_297511 [Trichonephila inaurata madagascariensis]